MMTFGYSFNIWVPLLAFPTAGSYGAPRWQRGWPVSFVFWFLLFAGFLAAIVLGKRGYVSKPRCPFPILLTKSTGKGFNRIPCRVVPRMRAARRL